MNAQLRPVVLVSLFALGGICGAAAHSQWTEKATAAAEREAGPTISSGEWSALKASIARVEAQLANAQLSAPGERAEVGASPIARESIEALAQTVRELQASIDQLRLVADKAARAMPDTATPNELYQAAREVNWPAIDALGELEAREKGAALRDVRFSTPSELLRRFGPPEKIETGDGGFASWTYTRRIETVEGPEWRGARFVFVQGTVLILDIQNY